MCANLPGFKFYQFSLNTLKIPMHTAYIHIIYTYISSKMLISIFVSQLSKARKCHSLSEGSTFRKGELWGGFWLNVLGRVVRRHLFYQKFRRYLETWAVESLSSWIKQRSIRRELYSLIQRKKSRSSSWDHLLGTVHVSNRQNPLWIIQAQIQPTFRQYYGGRLSW